ncbi:hypothetical protein SSX86_032996, partial [Deinandra increscens subsp. villosa]
MEIVRSQKKTSSSSAATAASSNGVSTLPLYRSAPTLEVRLEEFERFAVDRLLGHNNAPVSGILKGMFNQITLAHLKDQAAQSAGNLPALQPSSTYSVASSGVKYVTSKLLGSSGNGSRMLGFVGGNGAGSKANGGARKSGHVGGLSNGGSSTIGSNTSDGKGSYLIFNVGDTLYITELNSEEKDPIKSISFGNSNPVCHAFDSKAKDGHDLLIGLNSGDVYSGSLRLQLQDVGKKLVGAHHYNKDGALNN